MLGRRLLMFVAVALAATALVASLAPPPPGTVPPAPSPTAAPAGAESSLVERTIDARRRKPATVVVEEGDLLTLTVRSDEADAVELQGLAGVRAIAPETPVVFDVLPDVPGDYPVVLVDAGRTVGTVRVLTQKE